jgi:methionyl-tRNA formyltransferase
MRAALVGAVESSAVVLRTLVGSGRCPAAVVTLPLEKAGRHSDFIDLRPAAREAGVRVIETAQVNAPETLHALRVLELDYLLVVGWSQIVHADLLRLPRRGCIGYHPAPLPELRGRAVIPWTILLGRRTTGSTLFWLDEGVDSGDVLAQRRFDVAENETAASLMAKHMDALGSMVHDVLPDLAAGHGRRRAQDHSLATYCAKRTPMDGRIDWSRPAREVWTLIRAVGRPYPGAFTFAGRQKLVVWSADLVNAAPYFGLPGQVQALEPAGALVACGEGYVRLTSVQREGQAGAEVAFKLHERLGFDASAAPSPEGRQP